MICVICKEKEADCGYNAIHKAVTCYLCRQEHFPSFLKSKQYGRYWDAFSEKWWKENKE